MHFRQGMADFALLTPRPHLSSLEFPRQCLVSGKPPPYRLCSLQSLGRHHGAIPRPFRGLISDTLAAQASCKISPRIPRDCWDLPGQAPCDALCGTECQELSPYSYKEPGIYVDVVSAAAIRLVR